MKNGCLGVNFRQTGLGWLFLAMLVWSSGCGGGYTPPPPITVAVSPKRAAVTTGQTQTFTPTVTGSSNTSVTWEVDSVAGGSATVGTISAAGVYTPPTSGGMHTVLARSAADTTITASASIAVTDLAGVFTYHNDLGRTGANVQEFALAAANVKTGSFGKLFSCAVDGAIYAQPLWVANFTINGAKHNVVFVATQHDSVYAFDADANPCSTLWHANLLDSAHGGTAGEASVPSSGSGALVGNGFGDITPEVGITGTPVIDPVASTLYVVSKSVIPTSSPLAFFQRLHALDMTSGAEKFSGPVKIAASVPGIGDGSSAGVLAFDAGNQHQRSGLGLSGGFVYIAWASHEDRSPYHGWVIAYKTDLSQQVGVFNTTPNGGLGGIWMSGAAPAFDADGNIYFATGNGSFDSASGFGDSVIKLAKPNAGFFPFSDFFTPSDQATLNARDVDVAAGGVVALPDLASGPHRQLLVQVGKDGSIHLLDRNNLGQYCNGCPTDTQIVQEIRGQVNGMWGTPAYWNGNLYVGGAVDGGTSGDNLKAFSFNVGGTGMFSQTPTTLSAHVYNFSGPTPSVSSSGTTNGIVWAIDNSQYGPPTPNGSGPAVLHAYDATNLGNELWNSSLGAGNTAGNAVKFTVPTVANGKVYVGTRGNSTTNGGVGELDVYGLLPN
jgi:hypothetical protein